MEPRADYVSGDGIGDLGKFHREYFTIVRKGGVSVVDLNKVISVARSWWRLGRCLVLSPNDGLLPTWLTSRSHVCCYHKAFSFLAQFAFADYRFDGAGVCGV